MDIHYRYLVEHVVKTGDVVLLKANPTRHELLSAVAQAVSNAEDEIIWLALGDSLLNVRIVTKMFEPSNREAVNRRDVRKIEMLDEQGYWERLDLLGD